VRAQRGDAVVLRGLQKNMLNRRCWASDEQLRLAIITWIEASYHPQAAGNADAGG
jgi:hypothetical protein